MFFTNTIAFQESQTVWKWSGLQSQCKNYPAPAPELFFSWTWLQLWSSLFYGFSFCSFSQINIFICFGVPQVALEMNYMKYTKPSKYTKLFKVI